MQSTALDRASETGFGREKLCLIETKQLKIHEGDFLSIFLRRNSSFTQPAHGKPARKSQFSAQVKALLKRSKVFFPKLLRTPAADAQGDVPERESVNLLFLNHFRYF